MPRPAQNEKRLNHPIPGARLIATHRRRMVRILFVDDEESDV